jgi:putative membrane protein
MPMLATTLTLLVAIIHAYFVVLETVLWTRPRTRKVFGTTAEFASATKMLALNQGLYNGFLAAGLAFAIWTGNLAMVAFLLVCIVIAGIVGALTATRAAFVAQTVPASLALLAMWYGI